MLEKALVPLAALALVLAAGSGAYVAYYGWDKVYVDHTINGDTVETTKATVLLLGVDAPERGECYYQQAKDAARELLGTSRVSLERDPMQPASDPDGRRSDTSPSGR